MLIAALTHQPLQVPLAAPFVIATARMDHTRARLIEATLRDEAGREFSGLGEAATLPPVTAEDENVVGAAIDGAIPALLSRSLPSTSALADTLDAYFADRPVARASIETAILDAWAKALRLSVSELLSGTKSELPLVLLTDITLPIAEPNEMADDARRWRSRGFRIFKVKVGKNLDHDLEALSRISNAVADARIRIDANAGYTADEALKLLTHLQRAGIALEHFEQPCAREDLDAMAYVTARSYVPVIADESVRTLEDLHTVIAAKAAHGVNLKLVKNGGPLRSYEIGRAARSAGMSLMCGAMVETRLGLSAMAQVVRALGGVEYVDLDTAFLLTDDPFTGGYQSNGPELTVLDGYGHGVHRARH